MMNGMDIMLINPMNLMMKKINQKMNKMNIKLNPMNPLNQKKGIKFEK